MPGRKKIAWDNPEIHFNELKTGFTTSNNHMLDELKVILFILYASPKSL